MPFALGPTVTVRISSLVSVETGVLFHRMGQSVGTGVFLNVMDPDAAAVALKESLSGA
jgi:hypothetical protein